MGQALSAMQNSMKAAKGGQIVEDSVEGLIKKLESQGKKVKIINEDDDEDFESPESKPKKKKSNPKQGKRSTARDDNGDENYSPDQSH
jgi:hypothetical protein